jgi:RNA polymerase sigma factor for flagellar operon FliA
VAHELNLSLDELHGWLVEVRAVNLGSLDFTREEGGQDLLRYISDSEEKWPSRLLERAELARLVDDAIDKIPEAERRIIRLYYKENLTLREIAGMVGLHESRISQIKTQAIARLRGYVGKRWPTGRGD